MGLIKFFVSMFSCKSSCKFNNSEYNIDLHNKSLSQFKLKNKDITAIHKILVKRELHLTTTRDMGDSSPDNSINERPDTPYPHITNFKEFSV